MLQIFSDAGFVKGHATASTLILRDCDTFVTLFCKEYNSLDSCTVGELIALIQSLEWVQQFRPEERSVHIFIDNYGIVQKLSNYLASGRVRKGANPVLWLRLYKLCDGFDSVQIGHIPSHQQVHNPNKTCDILCSACLRPYKEVAPCTQ